MPMLPNNTFIMLKKRPNPYTKYQEAKYRRSLLSQTIKDEVDKLGNTPLVNLEISKLGNNKEKTASNSLNGTKKIISDLDKKLLSLAKEHKFQSVIKRLEDQQYNDINAEDNRGDSLLDHAIYGNNIILAKKLRENGAEINSYKPNNNNSILKALLLPEQNLSMVKWLYDEGANIMHKGFLGCNALHNAASSGIIEKIEFVLEKDSNRLLINQISDKMSTTPLEHAIPSGKVANVNLLLQYGAKITYQSLYSAAYQSLSLEIFNSLWQYSSEQVKEKAKSDNSLFCASAINSLSEEADQIKIGKFAETLTAIGVPFEPIEGGQTVEEACLAEYE